MNRARALSARRRSKPGLLARLRIFWVVLVPLTIVFAIAGYALVTWPAFFPVIASVSGARQTSIGEIERAAGLHDRVNLWLQSKRAAEKRIEALPYIKSAELHRSLFARVGIVVRERTAVALVHLANGSLALIDDEGRILQRGVRSGSREVVFDGLRAPLAPAGSFIADDRVGRLLRDTQTLRRAGVELRSIGLERFDSLAVRTRGGVRIEFGADTDLPAKVRLIEPILRTVGTRLGRIAALDLRSPKTPIVVYR